MRELLRGTGLVLALLLGAIAPAAGGDARCTGDCRDAKNVEVADLIKMVNIALDRAGLSACENGDRNGDGVIVIDELIVAVRHALSGCEGDIEPRAYKHSVEHPSDPYFAFPATQGAPSWVKFTIRVDAPRTVYFQNSGQTPLHHDFVATSLEPYLGWTPAEIDAVSLHAEGQELVFGAVLYSPFGQPDEIAVQLVRQDAYSAADVITYFNAVRAAVHADASVPFFYFPTFEQQDSAEEQRDVLAAAGIDVGSTARWARGDVCYAPGWAHGRVVYVAGKDIADAYADGTLRPDDILLTDGVPAEIPFVAGVLSLAPSTPSSHVAVLAGDWQIPFAYLAQADSAQAAQDLVGRDIVLRATTRSPLFWNGEDIDFNACQVRLVDVTDALDAGLIEHLRDLKRAPDLAIRPFVHAGSYVGDVDSATPDDIVTIGGKASNYGFLRRAIPDNSRPAIAFTFDLWNDYLDQPIDGGATLRQRIAMLLAPFPAYPPADFDALFSALDDVRDLIDDEADFTPAQQAAILAALEPFNPMLPIRFRSSTNVEDSDVFTGAGLYESESGCVADDVDGDDTGPSHCDASRPNERGVFRALRKVFQSFYNDNAFLERLRHRVDESTVGMAVLVNHTFTDDTELGNGVCRLRRASATRTEVTIISQPGAFSVTNPEDDGIPEIVDVFIFNDSLIPGLRQGADRLPLGMTVLDMPSEYVALTRLLIAVGDAFGAFHGETQFDIEFEYKKVAGEGLEVKQVRRIPSLTEKTTPPVLINAPMTLCTYQGERVDVFANYRLKSRWTPELASGVIEEDGGTFYAAGDHQFVLDGEVQTLSGVPSSWPDAAHGTFDPMAAGALGFTDSWSVGSGPSRRMMTLQTTVPSSTGPTRIPIVFPQDFGFTLQATFAEPVPYLDFMDETATRTEESVVLVPCADKTPLRPLQRLGQRSFSDGAVTIHTSFYWPLPPTGAVAGYTAPLDRWVESSLTGIVTDPVVLHGYFSQTYRPEHHNFGENFLFDPHLEAGFDPAILVDWDARGIQAVLMRVGRGDAHPRVLTPDGRIVDLTP